MACSPRATVPGTFDIATEKNNRIRELDQGARQLRKTNRKCFSQGWRSHYFTDMCSGSEAGSYVRLIDFVYHSTLGLRVIKKKQKVGGVLGDADRKFFIDNLLVRIHFIIVMIRWTGLAPWEGTHVPPRQAQNPRPEHPAPPSDRTATSASQRKTEHVNDVSLSRVIESGLARLNGFSFITSTGARGRGTTRAEDAQGTPTQSHISPSILVYEKKQGTHS